MLKQIKWIYLGLILGGLSSFVNALVLEQKDYQWSKEHTRIRVGVIAQRAPLEFIDESGKASGYAPSLLSHLAVMTRLNLHYQSYASPVAAVRALQQGDIDMLASAAPSSRLSPFVDYSKPTVAQALVLMNLLSKARFSELSELGQAPLALLRGSEALAFVREQHPQLNILEVDSTHQLIEAVGKGKAVALLAEQDVIMRHLRDYPQWHFQQSLLLENQAQHRFAVRQDWPELLTLLHSAMSQLPASYYQQNYHAWLKHDRQAPPPFWQPYLSSLLIAGVLLVLFFTIYGYSHRRISVINAQRLSLKEQLEHWQNHDLATGLPNRRYLLQLIKDYLAQAQSVSLFLFDFPRQTEVFENFGQRLGEATKEVYAKRVDDMVKQYYPKATLAYWHHHYFVVVLPNVIEQDAVERLARQIVQTCRGWLRLEQLQLLTRCHVGYASFDSKHELLRPERFLHQAYVAYSHALKNETSICAYDASLNQTGMLRLTLESRLRKAIENDELCLHLQPQFCLKTGALVGAEVLLRWFTHTGPVSPAEFVPVAEETGLVLQLDRWVYERAMQLLARLEPRLPRNFKLSVNFSAATVAHGHAETIAISYAQKWRVKPSRVCLEITESAMMEQPSEAKKSIQRLRNCGFGIAIDDFGTGYSSMAYLKHLPVSLLKIDRAFVRDIDENESDQHIVKAMVMIAKSMNYNVLIEGVESEKQARLAAEMGCEWAQGFLFSRPISEDDFVRNYLKNRQEKSAFALENV